MTDKRTTAETIKQRHGEDFFTKIGKKGGKAPYKGKRGFAAATPEQRAEWGRKGGIKNKRD